MNNDQFEIFIEFHCAVTDKGNRENNEDACIAVALGDKHLLAVADGVGGLPSGEVASRIVIETLKETIADRKGSMKELLVMGFEKANEEIYAEAERSGLTMGTTLVAALIDHNGKCVIGNVGDSRAYIVGDEVKRITKDHSYVQELVDQGIITRDEADFHPEKNIITQMMGMEIEPDFYEIEPGGKILLLCSDGITDAMSDADIRSVVMSSKNGEICYDLVRAARPKSRDNVTAAAAKLK